jgi:hypothetical protein
VVGCQAAAKPSGDAASQNALNGAAIELFEDLRVDDKSFQPQVWPINCVGIRALLCFWL